MEGALLVAAQKMGLEEENLQRHFPRLSEVPFSSERKLMSTIHQDIARSERLFVFSKGTPNVEQVQPAQPGTAKQKFFKESVAQVILEKQKEQHQEPL